MGILPMRRGLRLLMYLPAPVPFVVAAATVSIGSLSTALHPRHGENPT
jgi:hypothetical protein